MVAVITYLMLHLKFKQQYLTSVEYHL